MSLSAETRHTRCQATLITALRNRLHVGKTLHSALREMRFATLFGTGAALCEERRSSRDMLRIRLNSVCGSAPIDDCRLPAEAEGPASVLLAPEAW